MYGRVAHAARPAGRRAQSARAGPRRSTSPSPPATGRAPAPPRNSPSPGNSSPRPAAAIAPRIGAWLVAALLAAVTALPARAYDWLQFNGDAAHSGNNTAEVILGEDNVASLAQKFQVALPGSVDGAPVFLEQVDTPSGLKDLLFATTMNGWTVALDAATGAIVWSHQYGPNGCVSSNGNTCYTTSSPAIDPSRQYVYGYGLDGKAHKYRVGDGVEISTGGWPQVTTLKGQNDKASSALAIATAAGVSYLYVAHGGYPGDAGDYQGHVTAIDLATGAQNEIGR